MPNQQNYPEILQSINQVRPSRLTNKDLALILSGSKSVVFGQTVKDVVEIYLYDDAGNITGHINLRPTDKEVTLTNRVSEINTITHLNLDLASALNKANLAPGRYAMTTNIFRDEVGSEEGYKLYIATISTSRTELRLVPVDITSQTTEDIWTFTEPSIPPEFAQALIDQVFAEALNVTTSGSLTVQMIMNELDIIGPMLTAQVKIPGPDIALPITSRSNALFLAAPIPSTTQTVTETFKISDRINNTGTRTLIEQFVASSFPNIVEKTLDIMAANIPASLEIHNSELINFVTSGTIAALNEMVIAGQLDGHFQLV